MVLEIMHIDMDAFFAAVEQRDNPELKGKPVIIGGHNLDNRGVVSTASYEARKFGVHSAMTIVEARRRCPQGIFLPGRMKRYKQVSRKIFKIFHEFTPLVESISIDEAFLDLTGCHKLFGDSRKIGCKIKNKIQKELGLTASIGLAPNMFLAKLASDMDKPDGFFVIEQNQIDKILNPLSVKKIWGVGKKTAKELNMRGIKTIADLKKISLIELKTSFGKQGENLYKLSRGIDYRSVSTETKIKSISHEKTFISDIKKKGMIFSNLMDLSERVARRMRQKGFKGSTIFIKVRYSDFSTYTRRKTINNCINSTDIIYKTARDMLEKEKLLKRPIRLLGVGVGNLQKGETRQLSLFENEEKQDKLIETIDNIKDSYGEESIFRARKL